MKSLLARAEGIQLHGLTLRAGVHPAAAESDLQVHLLGQVRGDARIRSRSARLDGLLRAGFLLVTPAGEALEWHVGESLEAYGEPRNTRFFDFDAQIDTTRPLGTMLRPSDYGK